MKKRDSKAAPAQIIPAIMFGLLALPVIWLGFWLDGVYHDWRWH